MNPPEQNQPRLSVEEYGNALMESLGSVKAAKSDPGFIKIIKAEMNRSEDISTRSQAIPIKGEDEYDLEADIMAANNKGTRASFISTLIAAPPTSTLTHTGQLKCSLR